MPKKVCSFCGRSESEVKLLITGVSGFICEDCAHQAWDIVQSTGVLKDDKSSSFELKDVPKPVEIKKYLDEYIIGQDEAKRYLSVSSVGIMVGVTCPIPSRSPTLSSIISRSRCLW